MPGQRSDPSRDEIKKQVVAKIAAVIDVPPSKIVEDDRLEKDLGMTATIRRAMSMPYTKITERYENGRKINMADAVKLKNVKESIDLVFARTQSS